MDIIALVFLIAGKVANVKGLMTAAIVLSSVCIIISLIGSVSAKDNEDKKLKAILGLVIAAIILTLSIIFRVGM